MPFDLIVVGAGPSALTFLYCSLNGSNHAFLTSNILVVGEESFWDGTNTIKEMVDTTKPVKREFDPTKGRMVDVYPKERTLVEQPGRFQAGQDKAMLHSVHEAGTKAAAPGPGIKLMHVSELTKQHQDLKTAVTDTANASRKKLEFVKGKVTSVARAGGGFTVQATTAKGAETFASKQVVIASGAGPGTVPGSPLLTVPVGNGGKLESHPRRYKEILSGEEYVQLPQVEAGRSSERAICVYGGSATASWCVAHAVYSGASRVLWLARSGFKDANPAGRNAAIILFASEQKYMALGEIASINVLDVGDTDTARISVGFKASKGGSTALPQLTTDRRGEQLNVDGSDLITSLGASTQTFHQLVIAIGQNPLGPFGPAAILDGALIQELQPRYDLERRFTSEGSTLIAFATEKGDLWVVGAAVFRCLGNDALTKYKGNFDSVYKMFCESGTPPEGLAAMKASIKSVTGFKEISADPKKMANFNWKTADRQELKYFLLMRYPMGEGPNQLTEALAQAIADTVIAEQKKTAFGLSKEEFNAMVKNAALAKYKLIKPPFPVPGA